MNFTALKNYMDRLTDWIIPGNAISVWRNGEEVFTYASGYADYEHRIPMTPDHMVNLYSCTKPATAAAVLQLYEQGYFLPDDPVSDYLPEFREMQVAAPDGSLRPAVNPITVRHLLTMTAGLDYNNGRPFLKKALDATGGRLDTRTFVRFLAEEPLCFEPGEHWNYSFCYDVLPALVEELSGMKFGEYLRKNLFVPCGMNSAVTNNATVRERMAEQYRFEDAQGNADIVTLQSIGKKSDRGYVRNVGKKCTYDFGPELESGGACLCASVREYGRFADALANGGRTASGERILSRGTIDLMRSNQLNAVQRKDFCWEQMRGYGYGFGVRTMLDPAVGGSNGPVGEFGWGGAAGAYVMADPEHGFSCVYAHHMLNPQETYYQPRLRNVLFGCLED